MSAMAKRIVFGSIMIAAVGGVLWLDWRLEHRTATSTSPMASSRAIAVGVLFSLLVVAAFVEMLRLFAAVGVRLLPVSGLFGSLVVCSLPVWSHGLRLSGPSADLLLLVLAVVVLLAFGEQMVRHRTEAALRQLAGTFLAVLYLGVGTALVLSLRIRYGVPMLVLFLAAVKFTDIGAYFAGSLAGRHKIIPWLSPGKSWEGLTGGLVVAAGISVLVVRVLRIDVLTVWEAALFAAVTGLFGQFADLCESLLKRSAGVKDSGAAVPSFGGVLDIIDSPLLAAPAAVLLTGLLV
jgi:phosphatidate cytidylyltransferase